jgi:hypothetical protein
VPSSKIESKDLKLSVRISLDMGVPVGAFLNSGAKELISMHKLSHFSD